MILGFEAVTSSSAANLFNGVYSYRNVFEKLEACSIRIVFGSNPSFKAPLYIIRNSLNTRTESDSLS